MQQSIDLDDLSLIDHHCHGVVTSDVSDETLASLLSEADDPRAIDASADTPLGLAVRRWCAPAIGLEPPVSFQEYAEHRRSIGCDAVNRTLLALSKTDHLLLDTGYRADTIADVAGMAELSGSRCDEIVRLEAVAERVLEELDDPGTFEERLGNALRQSTLGAAGLKSILAYRHGFEIPAERPTPDTIVDAAERYLRNGRPRLTDETLLRAVLWAGVDLSREKGLPLQLHAGYGDPDITLHKVNPSLLTGWLREIQPLHVPVVFLHCYPFHRDAAYLAAVFPDVYFDVGLAINYLGPSAERVVAESLELAPFSKQLYSSDAFGAAELYFLGARLFRRSLARVLTDWIDEDLCSLDDAERIARQIGSENARRLYGLE